MKEKFAQHGTLNHIEVSKRHDPVFWYLEERRQVISRNTGLIHGKVERRAIVPSFMVLEPPVPDKSDVVFQEVLKLLVLGIKPDKTCLSIDSLPSQIRKPLTVEQFYQPIVGNGFSDNAVGIEPKNFSNIVLQHVPLGEHLAREPPHVVVIVIFTATHYSMTQGRVLDVLVEIHHSLDIEEAPDLYFFIFNVYRFLDIDNDPGRPIFNDRLQHTLGISLVTRFRERRYGYHAADKLPVIGKIFTL